MKQCEKCDSKNITIDQRWNKRLRGYQQRITCRDCGHIIDNWTDD